MVIKLYKPMTPGTRTRTIIDYSDLSKVKPEKSLLRPKPKNAGRNNRGVITVRHLGGDTSKNIVKLIFFVINSMSLVK